MTSPVFDFKSIRRSLERQEQKADFEEKNPKPEESSAAMYGWPYAMPPTPYVEAPAWYSKPVVWTPERGYAAALIEPSVDDDQGYSTAVPSDED